MSSEEAVIAEMRTSVGMLREQHGEIKAAVKCVDDRVRQLELVRTELIAADKALFDALHAHIASEDKRWSHAMRVLYTILGGIIMAIATNAEMLQAFVRALFR